MLYAGETTCHTLCMAFSFVIKNAMVIDGTGEPMHKADVGISGKEIKTIGAIDIKEGGEVIEGEGFYLMPGMIDLTNHADRNFSLFRAPRAENLVRQGITTIVIGACGISLAPLRKTEDIAIVRPWVDTSAINTDWRTFAEYRVVLARQHTGVHVASLVGHATIALQKENTPLLLEQALDEGARGLSISLHHAPGQTIAEDDLVSLMERVRDRGGLVSIHLRDEGSGLLSSVAEAIRLARRSGSRLHIAHLRALGRTNWPQISEVLGMIRRARNEDITITADVAPYGRTDAQLVSFLPAWAREDGEERLNERLANPTERHAIARALTELTLHPDRILFASLDKEKELVGKTLAQAAQSREVTAEEAFIDILRINNLAVRVFSKTISQSSVREMLQEKFTTLSSNGEIVTASEEQSHLLLERELPHPRSFGTLPRFFDRFVRKKIDAPGASILWEEAIRKATSLPASVIGLSDRGVIRSGARADLVLFDPNTIKDNASYPHPYQYPDGITHVFVNGKPAIKNGVFNPTASGEVL